MADTSDFATTYRRYQAALTKVNKINKTAVFDALANVGVERVTVTFDGAGDSGQIEEIVAYKAKMRVQLPVSTLTLHSVTWGSETITTLASPLCEAIENVCYGFLSEEHGGWENNDGAFGEFSFHVAEREIELDVNVRHTDSTHYSHTY